MPKKLDQKKPAKYIVTDGELVLELEKEGKWYSVTSPFYPEITTQGRTLEEAFEMARDVLALFAEDRAAEQEVKATGGPTKKTG
jgi:predicted RNase H-like HicB family nuclease